jgi:uncharacterized protein (TIGR02646 family)
VKTAIRAQLFADQGGLCCYCMTRLESEATKIEHWIPQSDPDVSLRLAWKNLLLACPGGAGRPIDQQTCDTRKADRYLRLNPLEHIEHRFRYPLDGRIKFDDPSFREDVDEILNLNAESLRLRRRRAVDGVLDRLGRERPGRWSAERLRRAAARLREPAADGLFQEFCMAPAYLLEKRARRG